MLYLRSKVIELQISIKYPLIKALYHRRATINVCPYMTIQASIGNSDGSVETNDSHHFSNLVAYMATVSNTCEGLIGCFALWVFSLHGVPDALSDSRLLLSTISQSSDNCKLASTAETSMWLQLQRWGYGTNFFSPLGDMGKFMVFVLQLTVFQFQQVTESSLRDTYSNTHANETWGVCCQEMKLS